MDKQALEKRRCDRLPGHRETILISPNGFHPVHDISAEGLCFECGNNEFFPSQLAVSIAYAGTPLYMREVSVRLVREALEEATSFIATPVKKVAVVFNDLDPAHQQQLSDLINHHCQQNR